MPLKPGTIKKIQIAINRFSAYLRFSSLGAHTLTVAELKDLARVGYIGKHKAPGAAIAEAYLTTLLDQKHPTSNIPKTTREGTISYLERMAALYSDKVASELGTDIMTTLETHFLPFVDRKEGKEVYEMLSNPKNHNKYLGNMLNNKVKNWTHRWDKIVKTETVRAANWGAADATLHNNPGKTPHEIHVYKQGSHDYAGSCALCKKFWFTPDGTPRIYRMGELLANGTNIGKKQKDWKATVDATHPHCVHIMEQVKPGYGFVNGKLAFISADHDALKAQESKFPNLP
jgi:hypothetical protein